MSRDSIYTFLIKPGLTQKFNVEPFYYNNSSSQLEPMSASAKSVPRALKKSFGGIVEIIEKDHEYFELRNKGGEKLLVRYSKLSPLLDTGSSMMKEILMKVYDKGYKATINVLKNLVVRFQNEPDTSIDENIGIAHGSKTLDITSSPTYLNGDELGTQDSGIGTQDTGIELSQITPLNVKEIENSEEESNGDSDNDGEFYESPRKKSKTDDGDDHTYNSEIEEKMNEVRNEIFHDTEEESLDKIENIISKAKFKSVDPAWCEVPSQLNIDRNHVNNIKEALINHPDKTQCLIGIVALHDEDLNLKGSLKVYVNPELFMAMRELKFEGCSVFKGNFFPAVIHELSEEDTLDEATLGMFLNNNSKDFSDKIRQGLTYQDLLKFCCETLSTHGGGSQVEVDEYLKRALLEFDKGRNNVSLFIKFAHLPIEYLKKFETFIGYYETGSLHGQKLSTRKKCNVDKKRKKKKSLKLEVPLSLFKLHIKVDEDTREILLDALLSKKISFTEYISRLSNATEIVTVKKCVENISRQKISELEKSHRGFFSDDVLKRFVGAKITPAGPNPVYKNLMKHINVALSSAEKPYDELVAFKDIEEFNSFGLTQKMKKYKLVVLDHDGEDSFNSLHSLKQAVMDNSSKVIGVIINVNDKAKLKEDLQFTFNESNNNCSIIIESVKVKRKVPLVENGFKKEHESVIVIGQVSLFRDRCISTSYESTIEDSMHAIIDDIVNGCDNILFVLFSEKMAFDLDPLGILMKKQVKVEYLSSMRLLDDLSPKIFSKKCYADID